MHSEKNRCKESAHYAHTTDVFSKKIIIWEMGNHLGKMCNSQAPDTNMQGVIVSSLLLYEQIYSERMGKKNLVETNQTVPFIMIYCCYTEMDNIVKFKTAAAHIPSKIIHCSEKILRNIFSAG